MFDGSALRSRGDTTDSHRIAGRSKKPLLLIGGGLGAVALVVIIVMAMRGKSEPKVADKPVEPQPDKVAVVTPDAAEVAPPIEDPPVTPPIEDPPVTPPVTNPTTNPPVTSPRTNPPVTNPTTPKNPKNPRIGKNPKNPPIETGKGSADRVNTGGGSDDDKNAKARAAYATGNQKLFSGDHDGAIQAYRQVIAMGSSTGYRGLGLAYAQQGDTQNAIAAFKKYIAMSPNAKDVALIKKRIAALGGR